MKILMAAGATGGHITNAINLSVYLKSNYEDVDIEFVISANVNFSRLLREKGFKAHTIPAGPLPLRVSFGYIAFLIKFLQSFIKSVIIISKFNPDIIAAFGSYSTVPVVLANCIRFNKAGVILHEQNVIPGKANALLSRVADKAAVSFCRSQKYFGAKTVFTGYPLKEELRKVAREDALDFFGLRADRFTILVMGGSQGADFINRLIINAISAFKPAIKDKIQVIHLAGERGYEFVCRRYDEIEFRQVKIFSFLDKMEYALSACDLAVARAGGASLAELTAMGKPSILIPYPYAGGHQGENARYIEENKAAIVFNQAGLDEDKFRSALLELVLDNRKLKAMSQNSKRLGSFDANEKLTKVIFEVLKKNNGNTGR